MERAEFNRRLLEAVFGGDDKLSYGEYRDAAQTLLDESESILKEITDKTSPETNKDLLSAMLQSVVGNGEEGKKAMHRLADEIVATAQSPELTEKILNGFEAL